MANHGFAKIYSKEVFTPTNRARKRVIAMGNDPNSSKFYDPRDNGGDIVPVRRMQIQDQSKAATVKGYSRAGSVPKYLRRGLK